MLRGLVYDVGRYSEHEWPVGGWLVMIHRSRYDKDHVELKAVPALLCFTEPLNECVSMWTLGFQ